MPASRIDGRRVRRSGLRRARHALLGQRRARRGFRADTGNDEGAFRPGDAGITGLSDEGCAASDGGRFGH